MRVRKRKRSNLKEPKVQLEVTPHAEWIQNVQKQNVQ